MLEKFASTIEVVVIVQSMGAGDNWAVEAGSELSALLGAITHRGPLASAFSKCQESEARTPPRCTGLQACCTRCGGTF